MATADEIDAAFNEAEDEFGDHKSTTFLASIVADRLGIDYGDVIDGLSEVAMRDPANTVHVG